MFGKSPSVWKLNTLPNNQWVKEDITGQWENILNWIKMKYSISKFVKLKKKSQGNEKILQTELKWNTSYKNLWSEGNL